MIVVEFVAGRGVELLEEGQQGRCKSERIAGDELPEGDSCGRCQRRVGAFDGLFECLRLREGIQTRKLLFGTENRQMLVDEIGCRVEEFRIDATCNAVQQAVVNGGAQPFGNGIGRRCELFGCDVGVGIGG